MKIDRKLFSAIWTIFVALAVVAFVAGCSCGGGNANNGRGDGGDGDDEVDDDATDDDTTDDDAADDDTGGPEAPTDLAASVIGDDVSLSWSDNSEDESGFSIYKRAYGSGDFALLTTVDPDVTNYDDVDLGLDKDIQYKVTAFNNAGESDPSNIVRVKTLPNAPSGLASSNVKKYQLTLSWTDNSQVESGYKVERKTLASSWEEIKTLPANAVNYTDSDINCETYFMYRVKAFNDAGDSEYSNTTGATTLGCWTILTLDYEDSVGKYTSMAIDLNDKVYITYFDETNMDLKYVTNKSGTWEASAVDSDVATITGGFSAIAIDLNGFLHVSYYDATNSDLKYAMYSDSWYISTLDSAGFVGQYTSIATDSNNKVHIGYYDPGNGDLKYATNASGSWQAFTIDSAGNVGAYAALAVDLNNKVHISYYDVSNGDLKYATNKSGAWQTYSLDSSGTVGEYTSIAIGPNNKVHISYFDSTNKALKYATNKSGSWQKSTLDAGPYVGIFTSIKVDLDGQAHISYHDYVNLDLKYTTDSSGETFTIDTGPGDVGKYTSIAIDSNEKLYISYYDLSNADLKCATTAEVE